MACTMDHSLESVKEKYESQLAYIPEDLHALFNVFFQKEHEQTVLNEVFHLLKKYDLATSEERENRNHQLLLLLG